MSKVVKGVIVGAIIGVSLGFALPIIGITAIGGTAITLGGAAIAGAIYGGLQGAALQFAKKPNMDMGAATGRLNVSIDSNASGSWVFGETPCATDLVFAEQIGDDVIAYVIAGAAHEIDSFGDLYLEEDLISFSGDNATGDWAGALTRTTRTGTDTQTAISIAGSLQWTSDAKGLGIAHYLLRFDLGNDDEQKMKSGVPSRITQVVKGSKVYDPRLDSTRGGDGAHRADDQSTWEWSDNWALIVAHYLLGYRQAGLLVYGVGISPDDIDWAQAIAMANVCDETVDDKPRYRVGGIFPTNQDHAGVIGQLEAAIDGKVSKVGGRYYIWCPHNDLAPLVTITDNMLLSDVGVNFIPAGPISDLFNKSRGRYIDPDNLYQPTPYPDVSEPDAITQDGRERLTSRDFSIVQDRSIAERIAREMIRRSRFSASWTVAMGPGGLLLQPFSVVTLNIAETDNEPVPVRVIDLNLSPQGVVVLTLREEDPSIYDTTIPLGTPISQESPDSFDPTKLFQVFGLSAVPFSSAGTGGTVSDAFRVTWSDPGKRVRDTEVRYKIASEDEYSHVQATQLTSTVIVPVESNTLYDIEARHISISGTVGPYASIQATSTATSRAASVVGKVSYSQANIWVTDGFVFDPPGTVSDATFTFIKSGTVIATRVMRGTLNDVTGKVAVTSLSSSGEPTSFSVLNNNSEAAIVFVEHDDSNVEVMGQFLVLADPDLAFILSQLETLDDQLEVLNDVTLPALQNDLDTLNDVTLPALQQELDDVLPIDTAKLTDNAVTTAKIADLAIEAGKLADGAATEAKIATNAITETKITNNAITSPKILAGAVVAGKIAAGAVQAGNVSAGAIQAGNIAAGAIQANDIAAGQITTAKLGALAVTADKIAANAVVAGKIAANAVVANSIAAGSVITNKIAAGAVTANEIAANTITANNILANTITGNLMAANGIITNSAQINNAIITSAKIQNAAVGTLKIDGQAVTVPVAAAINNTGLSVNTSVFTTLAQIDVAYGTSSADLKPTATVVTASLVVTSASLSPSGFSRATLRVVAQATPGTGGVVVASRNFYMSTQGPTTTGIPVQFTALAGPLGGTTNRFLVQVILLATSHTATGVNVEGVLTTVGAKR